MGLIFFSPDLDPAREACYVFRTLPASCHEFYYKGCFFYPPPLKSDYVVNLVGKILSVRVYLPELTLRDFRGGGGGGSQGTLTFSRKKILTGRHLEIVLLYMYIVQ